MVNSPLFTPSPVRPVTLWSQTATINANGNSGPIDMTQVSACWFSVFGPNGATGTTPTLNLFYDQMDAVGNWVTGVIALPQITSTSAFSTFLSFGMGISPTAPGVGMTLGSTGRITWQVGGTTPAYPGWTLSLIGR